MTYRIEFTETAEVEAKRAYNWIAEKSPRFAEQWLTGLQEAVDSLKHMPHRCKIAPENEEFEDHEIRQLLYGKRSGVYRILITVSQEDLLVRILHVRHGRMDIMNPKA